MCGLVGMVGTLEYRHKQAMRDLFFLNTLRGKDSTGLTAIDRKKQVLTRKMTVPGYEFIEYPVVDKAMCNNDQLWMGHGRFKTTGEVSRANAHPFEVLDDDGLVMLVGTHNGTLTNKYEIEGKLNGEKYDTDSEALFNWLVEAPTYKEAIKGLRGAWSLVWWDPTVDSLHFCRNDERPMTYAFTEDFKVLVWASEAWMIINACRRNNVKLATNDKGLSCYATLPDHLYTLEIPQERDKVLPDLKREGGYVGSPTKTFQNNSWWHRYGDDEPWHYGSAKTDEQKREAAGKKTEEKGKADTKKNNVVTLGVPPSKDFKGGMKGFDGETLSLVEFKKIRDKGCGWCKDKIGENTVFAFLNEDTLVCVRCLRGSHPKPDPLDDDLPLILTGKGKKEQSEKVRDEVKKVVG